MVGRLVMENMEKQRPAGRRTGIVEEMEKMAEWNQSVEMELWRDGLLSPGRMEMMEEWPAAASHSRRVRMERGGRRRRRLAWTHQRSFTLGVREDWYGQVGSNLRDEGWFRWRFSVVALFSAALSFLQPSSRFGLKKSSLNGRFFSLPTVDSSPTDP